VGNREEVYQMNAHRLTTDRNPKRLDGSPMYWPICWPQELIDQDVDPGDRLRDHLLFAIGLASFVLALCCL
jgi:hypothetical protein